MEPNQWKVEKFADIAWEEWVKQVLDLHRIVDAGTIYDPERAQLNEAITAILIDGLMPAFLELKQIRDPKTKSLPILDRQQPYEDLARKLWKAYKEHMQAAARLAGFKIGFLFDDDKKFNAGVEAFCKANPNLRAGFQKFLEETRQSWQNDLSSFRNKWLEHPIGDRSKYDKFYTPEYAEAIFEAVWMAIVDIMAILLELKLQPGVRLVEQHPDDPGPKWAQRFRFDHPAFRKQE